jgi:adenylate cyclase
MSIAHSAILAVGAIIAVYLFAAAPQPLPEAFGVTGTASRKIAVEHLFSAVNIINHEARRIYTARIVGGGKQAGLDFSEDWQDKDRHAGPLPALFLRLVASELNVLSVPLGLFLGSDNPINPSNHFAGEQKVRFARMEAEGVPQFFRTPERQHVAMFPDVASVEACVSCHNEHKTSPKRNWKIGDIMGATTWMYEQPVVSVDEFQAIVAGVYVSIERAWRIYVTKTSTFDAPPAIGPAWPATGARVLPDPQTFMDEVYLASAPKILLIMNRQLSPALEASVSTRR